MDEAEQAGTAKKLSKRQQKALEFRNAAKEKRKLAIQGSDPVDAEEADADVTSKIATKAKEKLPDELYKSQKEATKKERLEKKQAALEKKNAEKEEVLKAKAKLEAKPAKTKKRKVDRDDAENSAGATKKSKTANEKGNRFLLFIGNLPYSTTENTLREHLAACKPDQIRLPTNPTTNKLKGFAFAEFTGDQAVKRMNVCLRMHHTEFEGRKINVELTAGGGGKSDNRKEKIRLKNEKLEEERREIAKDKTKAKTSASTASSTDTTEGTIHPSRAALVQT
ncbi:uncharacterized protein V1510DRAFT_423708 [Dipodascopsis tothii]|uniref:uncharacterized protein n=1 Tax=Dipodascopsis tothii TaxID=44089 RepID=UPI0034CF18C7